MEKLSLKRRHYPKLNRFFHYKCLTEVVSQSLTEKLLCIRRLIKHLRISIITNFLGVFCDLAME